MRPHLSRFCDIMNGIKERKINNPMYLLVTQGELVLKTIFVPLPKGMPLLHLIPVCYKAAFPNLSLSREVGAGGNCSRKQLEDWRRLF